MSNKLTEIIKPSAEYVLLSSENSSNIIMLDPRTLGVVETYTSESSIAKNTLVASNQY